MSAASHGDRQGVGGGHLPQDLPPIGRVLPQDQGEAQPTAEGARHRGADGSAAAGRTPEGVVLPCAVCHPITPTSTGGPLPGQRPGDAEVPE